MTASTHTFTTYTAHIYFDDCDVDKVAGSRSSVCNQAVGACCPSPSGNSEDVRIACMHVSDASRASGGPIRGGRLQNLKVKPCVAKKNGSGAIVCNCNAAITTCIKLLSFRLNNFARCTCQHCTHTCLTWSQPTVSPLQSTLG